MEPITFSLNLIPAWDVALLNCNVSLISRSIVTIPELTNVILPIEPEVTGESDRTITPLKRELIAVFVASCFEQALIKAIKLMATKNLKFAFMSNPKLAPLNNGRERKLSYSPHVTFQQPNINFAQEHA